MPHWPPEGGCPAKSSTCRWPRQYRGVDHFVDHHGAGLGELQDGEPPPLPAWMARTIALAFVFLIVK